MASLFARLFSRLREKGKQRLKKKTSHFAVFFDSQAKKLLATHAGSKGARSGARRGPGRAQAAHDGGRLEAGAGLSGA
jgi:hypothetical protein